MQLLDIGVSYSDVSYLLSMIAGILALIGAAVIYRNWSAGKRDIERDLMTWGGGCLFFLVIQAVIKLIFY